MTGRLARTVPATEHEWCPDFEALGFQRCSGAFHEIAPAGQPDVGTNRDASRAPCHGITPSGHQKSLPGALPDPACPVYFDRPDRSAVRTKQHPRHLSRIAREAFLERAGVRPPHSKSGPS